MFSRATITLGIGPHSSCVESTFVLCMHFSVKKPRVAVVAVTESAV